MTINHLKIFIKNYRFRKRNKHNDIKLISNCNIDSITAGICSYGNLNVEHYNPEARLKIGHYVSIADGVVFLLGGEHDYRRITTFPFQTKIYGLNGGENQSHYDILIEDDVWIGYGATILSGVTIGKGSVIAARSVVAKDVPPYSIFIGNRVDHFRFEQSTIDKLMNVDFSKIHHHVGDEYQKYIRMRVQEDNADDIIRAFASVIVDD